MAINSGNLGSLNFVIFRNLQTFGASQRRGTVSHFTFWISLSLRPNRSTLVSVPSSD